MREVLADLLGEIIRGSGSSNFPGKCSRAIPLWMSLKRERDKRIRVLPGGGKVLCDFSIPYECMVWLKQEEQRDLEVLRYLLKPGEMFVDCGANIGIWTLVAAATVGQAGRVFAFEPHPLTADKLASNIALSGLANVSITRAAVGKNCGELVLHSELSHNTARIVENITNTSVTVPSVTLDHALDGKEIAGCKIDVESFEMPVLQGAERLIENRRAWFCIEFNTELTGVNTLDNWDVHKLLKHAGYEARLFNTRSIIQKLPFCRTTLVCPPATAIFFTHRLIDKLDCFGGLTESGPDIDGKLEAIFFIDIEVNHRDKVIDQTRTRQCFYMLPIDEYRGFRLFPCAG